MDFSTIVKLYRPVVIFKVLNDVEFYEAWHCEDGTKSKECYDMAKGDIHTYEAEITSKGGLLLYACRRTEYYFQVEAEDIQILAVGSYWVDNDVKITHINDGSSFLCLEKANVNQVMNFFKKNERLV